MKLIISRMFFIVFVFISKERAKVKVSHTTSTILSTLENMKELTEK